MATVSGNAEESLAFPTVAGAPQAEVGPGRTTARVMLDGVAPEAAVIRWLVRRMRQIQSERRCGGDRRGRGPNAVAVMHQRHDIAAVDRYQPEVVVAVSGEEAVVLAGGRKQQLSGIYPSVAAGRERRDVKREIRSLADARAARSLIAFPGNRRRAVRSGSNRSGCLPNTARGPHGDLDRIGIAARTAAAPRNRLISVIVASKERDVLGNLAGFAGPGDRRWSAPAAPAG